MSGNGIARLFLTIVSAFAEFERDRIGERIRATKRAQKARGEYLGGKAPFGFTYDADRKLVPVAEQQKALRRIRTLHDEGLSPYKISADLATHDAGLTVPGDFSSTPPAAAAEEHRRREIEERRLRLMAEAAAERAADIAAALACRCPVPSALAGPVSRATARAAGRRNRMM